MSKRSKEEKLSEYERDYLERLSSKGKMKSMQSEKPTISEEERTRKVEEAEKIQIVSAQQIQEASAAKIQSEELKLLHSINQSVNDTIDRCRNRQSQVGRARIFGEKSIGLDDPGMLAFMRMFESLESGSFKNTDRLQK